MNDYCECGGRGEEFGEESREVSGEAAGFGAGGGVTFTGTTRGDCSSHPFAKCAGGWGTRGVQFSVIRCQRSVSGFWFRRSWLSGGVGISFVVPWGTAGGGRRHARFAGCRNRCSGWG